MSGITCPSCGTLHAEAKKFCFKCGFNLASSQSPENSLPASTTSMGSASQPSPVPPKPAGVNFGNPLKPRKVAEPVTVDVDHLNSAIPNVTTFIPHSFAHAKWRDGLQAALVMISAPVVAAFVLLIYLSTQHGASISGGTILGTLGSIISLTFGGQLTGGDTSGTGTVVISFLPSTLTLISMLLLSQRYKKHLKDVSISSNVEFFTDLLLFLLPSALLVLVTTLLFRGNMSSTSSYPIHIAGSVAGAVLGFAIFSFITLVLAVIAVSTEVIQLPWIQTARQYLLTPMWAIRRGLLVAMALTLISFCMFSLLSSARSSFLYFFVIIVVILPTLTAMSIGLSTFSPLVSSGGLGSTGTSNSLSLNTLASIDHAVWVLPVVVIISLIFTAVIMILRRSDAQLARRDGGVLVLLFAIGVIFVLIFIHVQISGNVSALGLSLIPTAKESISGISVIMVPLAVGITWVCSGLLLNRVSTQTLGRWSHTVNHW